MQRPNEHTDNFMYIKKASDKPKVVPEFQYKLMPPTWCLSKLAPKYMIFLIELWWTDQTKFKYSAAISICCAQQPLLKINVVLWIMLTFFIYSGLQYNLLWIWLLQIVSVKRSFIQWKIKHEKFANKYHKYYTHQKFSHYW